MVSRLRVTLTVLPWARPSISSPSVRRGPHIGASPSRIALVHPAQRHGNVPGFLFDAPLLAQHRLGKSCRGGYSSHSLPGTDSPVLQVLPLFSKLQFASVLEIFKHVLDGDY